jgi:hypothetical protein
MSPTQRPSSFDEVIHPNIVFTGEQNGPFEDVLKQKLADIFGRARIVSRSYLARATVDDGQDVHVILCLRAKEEASQDLVAEIGSVFATIFNANEHLDIVFLGRAEEEKLARVCRPFFARPREPA